MGSGYPRHTGYVHAVRSRNGSLQLGEHRSSGEAPQLRTLSTQLLSLRTRSDAANGMDRVTLRGTPGYPVQTAPYPSIARSDWHCDIPGI